MADEKDNVLGIQATINGDDIQKGATDFINKISDMERAADRATNSMADGFQFLDRQIQQLSSSLEANRRQLESVFSQMQSFKPTNQVSTEAYTKLQDEYARAMNLQQQLEGQLSKATVEINEQRQAYEQLTEKIRENGKEAVAASLPQSGASTDKIKSLKEELKLLGAEIKNNEKLYDQQVQKLNEYESKIERYQSAQAKGMKRIGIGNAKSELIEPALQKTLQDYEELRQKQTAIVDAISQQKQKQQELNSEIEQANPKVVRFRTELMNIKQQMMEMRRNGQANTEEFSKLQQKAMELQRTMTVTNKQTQLMASPKLGFQATREGVTTLTGALSAGMGVMALFNEKSEDLAKIQTRLQSVMAITMGVQQLMSVTYATSALRIYALGKAKLFLTTTTNGLRTAFIGMGLSATGASIAVTALYAALTLGISAAITAIVTAISSWISKNEKLEETQKKQKERLEEEQKLRKNAANAVAQQLAEYRRLQTEYKSMNGSLDKQKKFVRDNQTEFQKLGVSIKDVNDAENLFVSNEQAFIDSLQHRALAAAAMAQMQEQYKVIIDKMVEKDDYVQKLGDKGTLKSAQAAAIDDVKKMLVKKGIVKTADGAQAFIPEILAAYNEKRANKNTQLKGTGIQEAYNRLFNKYARSFAEMEGMQLFDNSKGVQEAEKKIKQLAGIVQKNTTQADKTLKDANIDKFNKGDKKEENEKEKLRKQTEKYKLLLSQQELEKVRAEEDLQMKVDEANIKAMGEGSKKTIAQMELNFEKEMQAIDRQKEDALRKKIEYAREAFVANPENKGKTFDATGIELSDTENEYYNSLYKSAIISYEKVYNELADKYQSYADERLAIEKKYNDDVAVLLEARKKAEEKGDSNGVAKINRSIEKRTEVKNEDTAKLDAEQFKKSMNWEQVFGNLDKVSTETLKNLKAKLKDFIAAQKDLSPESLKELVDALENLDEKISERNPFESMSASFKALKSATNEKREAQKAYNKALKEGTEEEKKNAKATLESAKNNKQKALTEATMALHDGVDEVGRYVEAGNQVLGIMETLGVKTPEWLNKYMGGVGEMLNGLSNIDLTKPMSIVTGSLQTIKGALTSVISLGGLIPGLGGADYSGYQKMKEQYDNLNAIWDELIDKKKEYIEMSYGTEANKVGKEALELAEKSIESYRILGRERLNSGASMGSHSIGKRMVKNTSASDWQDIANAIGMSLKDAKDFIGTGRMTGLFDLTAEQLEKLKGEAPTFWAKMDSDVRDYLNSIIEGSERIEDIQNQVKEQLTQVSFDSVFDSFVDTLMDMDSSAEDFADNFEEYMQRAVLTTMVGDKYKNKLQSWYDSFAKANDDEAGITKEEMDKSQKEWDAIVAEAVAERDKLKDLFGWTGNDSFSQSSTNGGFQTMSQDTGSELNGRFTAFQISNEEIKNQSILQTGLLQLISVDTSELSRQILIQNQYVSEIVDIQHDSLNHLSEINKNTKQLFQMNERLGKIEQNTKGLTSR